MPFTYTPKQREEAIKIVVAGLSKGTPLAVICRQEGMPSHDAIMDWAADDEQIGRSIARAREVGFDQIAMDALAIADHTFDDTKKNADGREVPDSEWITRSRLRVETRLKLLAKWDPKRYGEKLQLGSDPDAPLPSHQITVGMTPEQAAEAYKKLVG